MLLFSLIYLIILKPEIALVLILLGSWLLVSIRIPLSSFFASFSTTLNYRIWDTIEINDIIGRIKEKKITSIYLVELNEDWFKTWNEIKIPNYQFIEKNVKKIKSFHKEKEFELNINLEELQISLNDILKEIDNIFYKKIEKEQIHKKYNKKRYNLDINMKKVNEYEIRIKYECNENTNSIEQEIIDKILEFKKSEENDSNK